MSGDSEETIELSGAEADMLQRMRESKVDPNTVAAKEEPGAGEAAKKPPAEQTPAAAKPDDVEDRVKRATETAVREVTRKAEHDAQAVQNVEAMTNVIDTDATFAGIAAHDKAVYGDVQSRVAEALAEKESVDKIRTMSRPEYLQHIADLTKQVLVGMKEGFGIKEDENANLDKRLEGASTGVGGSGGRHSGTGTGKDMPDPDAIFQTTGSVEPGNTGVVVGSREGTYPTQAEIEARHKVRLDNMRRKGEL